MRVAVLAVALAGCTTTTQPRYMEWRTCEGTTRGIMVETRYSSFPPIACAALGVEKNPAWAAPLVLVTTGLTTPLACTLVDYHRTHAVIVSPPHPPEWMVRHEMARVMDNDMSLLRPWGKPKEECLKERR